MQICIAAIMRQPPSNMRKRLNVSMALQDRGLIADSVRTTRKPLLHSRALRPGFEVPATTVERI